MFTKRSLLCARALCGSLALIQAQPARAACVISLAQNEITGDAVIESPGTYEMNGRHLGAESIRSGTLAPGNGIGAFAISSDHTQPVGDRLDIEVGAPGSADLFQIVGVVTLTGTASSPCYSTLAASRSFRSAGGIR